MSTVADQTGFTTVAEVFRSGLRSVMNFARTRVLRRKPQRLELRETLSLGNRGFLAVVRFERQQFLVGGTNNSLAMLAHLPEAQDSKDLPRSHTGLECVE